MGRRPGTVGRNLEPPQRYELGALSGPIVDRLLLTKGIAEVDSPSRALLLLAFWQALDDAFASRRRNAQGTIRQTPEPSGSRS